MKKFYTILILLIIALDQGTKYLVVSNMSIGDTIPILGNWLRITYVQNTGVAFSMFSGNQWITIAFTSILLIVCIVLVFKIRRDRKLPILLSCIFAGGAGNLIDRLSRGYVVDMISCGNFAVFNVADMFVTCACLLTVFYLLFVYKDK